MRRPIRLRPGWRKWKSGFRRTPILIKKGHCMASWSTPPDHDAHGQGVDRLSKEIPQEQRRQDHGNIKDTGDRAGAAKWRSELSIPMHRATREMKKI